MKNLEILKEVFLNLDDSLRESCMRYAAHENFVFVILSTVSL